MSRDVENFFRRARTLPKRKALASLRGKETVLKRKISMSKRDLELFRDLKGTLLLDLSRASRNISRDFNEGATLIRKGFRNI